jgi:hypothetical protein
MKISDLKHMYPSLGMSFHLFVNKLIGWWRYPLDPTNRQYYEYTMSGLSYREDR